jgi:hypothetical protein
MQVQLALSVIGPDEGGSRGAVRLTETERRRSRPKRQGSSASDIEGRELGRSRRWEMGGFL